MPRPKPNPRICLNCQGNGKLYKEVKPGKWEYVTCPACKGTGIVIIENI